jgi:hypothetical protein
MPNLPLNNEIRRVSKSEIPNSFAHDHHQVEQPGIKGNSSVCILF